MLHSVAASRLCYLHDYLFILFFGYILNRNELNTHTHTVHTQSGEKIEKKNTRQNVERQSERKKERKEEKKTSKQCSQEMLWC